MKIRAQHYLDGNDEVPVEVTWHSDPIEPFTAWLAEHDGAYKIDVWRNNGNRVTYWVDDNMPSLTDDE